MLGIRGKILLISVSLVVLGIGISIFLNTRAFRQEHSLSLQAKVMVVSHTLRAQLDRIRTLGLDAESIKGFEIQCRDAVREHPNLSYAMIVRKDGTVLFHSNPSLHGTILKQLTWLSTADPFKEAVYLSQDENGEYFYNAVAPSLPGKHGNVFVVVGFPSELIDAEVRTLAFKSAIFGVGATLFSALLLMVIITISVTKPLSVLVGTIRQIRSSGDLSKKVAIRSRDEIGVLSLNFNEMVDSLRKAQEELEDRVRDRTAELTKVNQELQREIDRREQTEQALRESHQFLEQRVTERTKDLVQANEQIRKAQIDLVQSEKMSMLGHLVAGVAHEINTPTSAILNVMTDLDEHIRGLWNVTTRTSEFPPETSQWLASVIARQLAQPLAEHSEAGGRALRRSVEEELRRQGCENARQVAAVIVKCFGEGWRNEENLLDRVQSAPVLEILEHVQALRNASEISLGSARKIARIVKALRYYSHAGREEMMDLNVNESIDNTLVILQNRIKHIAEVRLDFADNLPFVRTGPDISQVWTNLLNNACDAIEENRPEGQLGKIEIVTRREGDEVVVEVSDDGPQIPESVMPSIFDPFFTTKEVGQGTGLGLAVAYRIVEGHGGRIEVESLSPRGCRFRVVLPEGGSP
ncbi:MAG TPA: hypothetical protein DCX07_11400 [Phycisphaerales bacterium]|nr:hypothetical protein [Phycisphaerales bacterium]